MSSASKDFPGTGEFFAWRPAAWLRVSGGDAFSFLQGQFTNDLRELERRRAVYGLWLNHKGRVLADSFVLRAAGGEAFWVGSYFSPAAAIRERLEAFVIADDVVIEDQTGEWAGVTRFGGSREAVLGDVGVWFEGRRGAAPSTEEVFPLAESAGLQGRWAGALELSAEEMGRRRILARIAAVPLDIGPGELPNEGGLEAVAISYTKGCYLGQEVMARLKSMGQVRRRLLRVRGRGPLPTLPAALFQQERKVGELRSAIADGEGYVGLGLMTLLNLQEGAAWSLAPGGAGEVTLIAGEGIR